MKIYEDNRLKRWKLLRLSARILPKERVNFCYRNLKFNHHQVTVLKHELTNKHFYQGLFRCSSVWICPICSVRIAKRRAKELMSIIEKFKQEYDGNYYMATFTLQHTKKSELKYLLKCLIDSFNACVTGRFGEDFKRDFKLFGYVRSLEVTHGKNGYHPHLHVLFFSKSRSAPKSIFNRLSDKYCAQLEKRGFTTNSHTFSVESGHNDLIADYISKWSAAHEMTHSFSKSTSMTMWDVLEHSATSKEHMDIFRIYAQSFKGRHFLQYSHGIKKFFKTLTDSEINEKNDDDINIVLGSLSKQYYDFLFNNDLVVDFLTVCESAGYEIAYNLYDDLMKKNTPPVNIPMM